MEFHLEEKKSPLPVILAFLGMVGSFYLGTQNSILFYTSLPSNIPDEGILIFYQPSCPHCVAEIPTIKRLVEMGYRVHAINVLKNPVVAAQFGVTETPTIVILPSGTTLVGEQDLNTILRAIETGEEVYSVGCSVEVTESCGVT